MTSSLFLGIDTGGTFTDGVLLDPEQRQVVQTTKVLTTHQDLRICIAQVLDALARKGMIESGAIRLVSLSTTLATNAIVEGKSRPVGLFLLGYDPDLVHKYQFQQQFGTPNYVFLQGGMNLQGNEQAPLDESGLAEKALALRGQVEAFAVSSYAGTVNSSHEERAGEIIGRLSGLPVVQGHQLTSRMNSIRRATTATLNAGLLSTAYDFLHAVRTMLAQRGISCPLAIVRGDGSLVSADFAEQRPVEIIHSGPATSAIGGMYLAGTGTALVIDIGGTTTDLSLVQNGRVLQDGGEATVGGYPTSVRTIRSRSFGLGGDSQIRFDPRGLVSVGPERVLPLSYLAYQYPHVKQDLKAWLCTAPDAFYSDRLEFWLLRREPLVPFTDPRTQRALELLRSGPKRMAWLLKQAGAVSPVQVDGGQLTRQDIITRAGFTPTDLLHATGEYSPWDAEMASMAVDAVARMLGLARAEFIQSIRNWMARSIVGEIVTFLTGQPVPQTVDGKNGSLGRWMFDQNLERSDPFVTCQIQLKMPLVGIGAPARAFLTPVADALGTPILFPQHYEVANAVGTVVGSVLVQKTAEVFPQVEGQVISGYIARVGSAQQRYDSLVEALAHARAVVREEARVEAVAAGAVEPDIEINEQEMLGSMYTLTARAMGKPGFLIPRTGEEVDQ